MFGQYGGQFHGRTTMTKSELDADWSLMTEVDVFTGQCCDNETGAVSLCMHLHAPTDETKQQRLEELSVAIAKLHGFDARDWFPLTYMLSDRDRLKQIIDQVREQE